MLQLRRRQVYAAAGVFGDDGWELRFAFFVRRRAGQISRAHPHQSQFFSPEKHAVWLSLSSTPAKLRHSWKGSTDHLALAAEIVARAYTLALTHPGCRAEVEPARSADLAARLYGAANWTHLVAETPPEAPFCGAFRVLLFYVFYGLSRVFYGAFCV